MDFSISVDHLSINYGNSIVVENINLEFKKNTFTALIGNNGSGKSSFLRTICGLHKGYSGKIQINGKSINQIEEPFKSGLISLLSQNQQISFDIGVSELLLMGRFRFKKIFSNYTEEDLSAVDIIAKELDISRLLNKNFYELSGGEQQLILVAQALVQDAEIYLFDEPTQNLDLKNAHLIIQIIANLAEKGKTVVCCTHDLHLLEEINGEMVNLSSNQISIKKISGQNLLDNINLLRS